MNKNIFSRLTTTFFAVLLIALPARAQDRDPETTSEEQPALTQTDQAMEILVTIGQGTDQEPSNQS